MQNLARHVLWLYGIIAGLALREALTRVVPALYHPFDPPEHAAGNMWDVPLEGARLLIVLVLITKFYFGAASYFEEEHAPAGTAVQQDKKEAAPATTIQRRNVALDLGTGLFHFLALFALSMTVNVHDELFPGVTAFTALLALVLLYDLWWWALTGRYDTSGRVLKWAALNLLTLLICAAGYVPLLIWKDIIAAELWLLVVVPLSWIDLAEIVRGEEIYLAKAQGVLRWMQARLTAVEQRINRARRRG